jgi:phosphate ABC transporter permease protein PstC
LGEAESETRTLNSKHFKEQLIKYSLLACAASSIIIVLGIVILITSLGYPQVIDWFSHGFGFHWMASTGNDGSYGILGHMWGTIYVAIGAVAIGSAIGIPCGIYLAEFAKSKLRNTIKPTLEMLAGFPSIVIGLIGITVVVRTITVATGQNTVNTMAGWIVLAIIAVPTIASVSEDAIRRVPHELREASLGIGATKWQTTTRVLIPSAKSGIMAAILLALGEAIGEVMAVYYVMGNISTPQISLSPFSKSSVLTALLLNGVNPEYTTGDQAYAALFGVAVILFIICALLNIGVKIITKGGGKIGNKNQG